MDYDISCLNFASVKTMRSGNLVQSCRVLFPSKVWDAIKHHYSHHPPSETPPPSETKRFFELPQHPLTPIFLLLEGIVLVDK